MTCEQVTVQGEANEQPLLPGDDKKDNSSLYIIGAAALLGAYLLFGDRR